MLVLTCRQTATRRIRWISGLRGPEVAQKPPASAHKVNNWGAEYSRRAASARPLKRGLLHGLRNEDAD